MTATITGNLTRDPELRFAKNGTAMCSLSVAVNRKRGDEDVVSFFDVITFGTLAENSAETLTKGQRVIVTGRLEQRSWETDAGDRRSKVEIVADEVGPSLRWATAIVARANTTDGPGDPAPAAGRARPATGPAARPAYDDTDPF